MCRRIDCPKCGRPTYAGCGAHVEKVLAGVPSDARCRCREVAAKPGEPQPKDERTQERLP
jgi:hypothetical protein